MAKVCALPPALDSQLARLFDENARFPAKLPLGNWVLSVTGHLASCARGVEVEPIETQLELLWKN